MPAWMKWTIALLIGFAIIVVGFPLGAAWLLTPFFVLNCLVLIIVVLLQSGKAADLGRSVRRSGQPDGIWPARSGDGAFAGDHLVRGDVHGLRAGDGGEGGSAPWTKARAVARSSQKFSKPAPKRRQPSASDPGSSDAATCAAQSATPQQPAPASTRSHNSFKAANFSRQKRSSRSWLARFGARLQ